MVETSGIGQGDAAIVPLVDVSLYVMTPEFGAASQLEKIDMLDFADFVAINKFDRKGAEDALRDVRKQIPAQPRSSSAEPRDDAGVRHHRLALQRRRRHRALPGHSLPRLAEHGLKLEPGKLPAVAVARLHAARTWSCRRRASRYLAEIADSVRGYHGTRASRRRLARERQQLRAAPRRMLQRTSASERGSRCARRC